MTTDFFEIMQENLNYLKINTEIGLRFRNSLLKKLVEIDFLYCEKLIHKISLKKYL